MTNPAPKTEVYWRVGIGRFVVLRRFRPKNENEIEPRQFVIRSLVSGHVYIADETDLRPA